MILTFHLTTQVYFLVLEIGNEEPIYSPIELRDPSIYVALFDASSLYKLIS